MGKFVALRQGKSTNRPSFSDGRPVVDEKAVKMSADAEIPNAKRGKCPSEPRRHI